MSRLTVALLLALLIASPAYAGDFAATLLVDGQSQRIDIRGRDGSDGRSGASGASAVCFSTDISKSGEDGRDGANGSDGENGGNVLAYVSDLVLLKNISISSVPGRGGLGGLGGAGGSGCHAGPSGSPGQDGHEGSSGRSGSLYLVRDLSPLSAENISVSSKIGQLTRQPTRLIRHLWNQNSGALSLLASDSVVADSYYTYAGSVEKTVLVSSDAGTSSADLANESMTLSLDEANRVRVGFSPDTLAIYTIEEKDGMSVVNISDYAARLFNVTVSVRPGGLLSSDKAIIAENGRLSENVKTTFSISVEEKDGAGEYWSPIAAVAVDAKYIKASAKGEQINLSALISDQLGQYRTRFGKRRLMLTITRSLQDQQVRRRYALDERI